VIATEIVSEETRRLEMPFHSEVAHVLFHGLDKLHPPGEVAWQSDFGEIYEFMVRHGRGLEVASVFHLITANNAHSLAHVLAKCFPFA